MSESLFSRLQKLRDFLIEKDRRLYTHGHALTADDLSAVLNLIEAAQIHKATCADSECEVCEAVAVFVSGRGEPQ